MIIHENFEFNISIFEIGSQSHFSQSKRGLILVWDFPLIHLEQQISIETKQLYTPIYLLGTFILNIQGKIALSRQCRLQAPEHSRNFG